MYIYARVELTASFRSTSLSIDLPCQANARMISLISLDFPGEFPEGEMADLLVRGIDEDLVRALKERAGAHGRSAEAEHREILAAALARPRRRSFAEVLASMPEVGADADFERAGSSGRARDVFD
jgi:plasmid stability protein